MPASRSVTPSSAKATAREVDALPLEQVRHLERAAAVSCGLDHGHHPFAGTQQSPEIVQVVLHAVEIDFQHGRVNLVLEHAADPLEPEPSSALEQNAFSDEARPLAGLQEIVGRQIEFLPAVEQRGMAEYLFADADQLRYAVRANELRHAGIQLVRRQSALVDVREDQYLIAVSARCRQVLQRDFERVDIRVVRVVDDFATVYAVLELEPHGDALQPGQPLPDRLRVEAQRAVQRERERGVRARGRIVER